MAVAAGKVLKAGFNRQLTITYKGRIDPVTDIDLRSEKLITSNIRKLYPGHAILTEEGTNAAHESDFRWIIDPLDGTVNFAHGFPVYCVSIGVEYQGEIACGAVCDPERNELFWSVKGDGAFVNKKRIRVSVQGQLERSLIATGFAYDIGTSRRNNLGLFARMAKRAQGVRRPGSAAIDLCWLASGRVDGFWELKLRPWDTAAAKLIVEEAGGTLSRIDGSPYSLLSPDLLASNGLIHREMMSVLNRR